MTKKNDNDIKDIDKKVNKTKKEIKKVSKKDTEKTKSEKPKKVSKEKDEIEIVPQEKIIIKKEGFNLLEVIIIMFITLVFGTMLGSALTLAKKNINIDNNTKLPSELEEFVETYEDLKENYYEKIDKNKLLEAGIEGMIEFLGDKYSVYMNKEETEAFNEEVDGKYVGIGAEIKLEYIDKNDLSKFNVVVHNPFTYGSAYKAGIRKGDVILKVNGESIEGLPINKVADKIKGKQGTSVKIVVLREDKEIEFDVIRKKIELESVKGKVIKENSKNVGYIKIDVFAENTGRQFEKELLKLESENIDSLIIDVRDNSGGYLSVVKDIASMFLDKTKIIYQLDTKGVIEKVHSNSNESRKYPITVLINEFSASASEILAGSLLESYGASVVGVNSFGKGTVQKAYQLGSGATIKYTVQKWLTPNGNWINEKGITPTLKVEQSNKYYDTFKEEDDLQLQKALENITK